MVFSVSALTSFLRPPKLCTQNLSFFFLSCLRAFPRCNRARACARSRETEYKLKSRLIFFSFFFRGAKTLFSVSLSNISRKERADGRERERDLVQRMEAQTFELAIKCSHHNKQREEKIYQASKRTTFFYSTLFFFNVSKTFFFTSSYLFKKTLYSSRSHVASTRPPMSESIVFG